MKIERIVSLVQNRLGLGRFHEEVVREALSRAYNTLLSQEDDLAPFRKRYHNIGISKDEYDMYYSNLPTSVANVDIPVLIYPTKVDDIIFVPTEDGEMAVLNNLDVSIISDTILYRIQGNKIYYEWMNSDIDEVRLELIPDIEGLDWDEDIYVPQNLDEVLVETTVNFLMGSPPFTNINDGSDIT